MNITFASPLDAALQYAAIGWPIFPCKPDKHPYTPHGFHDATTDQAKIVDWWRQWPQAGVAVACGAAGLCVVDLDLSEKPDGTRKDGPLNWGLLEDEHGGSRCGLIAATPRGGRHYFYLDPDRVAVCRQDLHHKGSGIDVRATGGYVVLPSPASPGRDWSIGSPFDADDINGMPEWVERLVVGSRPASSPSTGPKQSGVEMPLSDRQVASIRRALQHVDADPRDTWIRIGMALKSTGARDQAYEVWCEWSRTSPKFDPEDQRYQWNSIREFRLKGDEVTIATLFHLAQQGGYVEDVTAEVVAEAEEAEPAPPPQAKPLFPAHLLQDCPGVVGELGRWILTASPRPQPALCLASAIATIGAILGQRVATETDLRTNVYCLGIGETGCGKNAGVTLPSTVLARAGLHQFVGPGEWKSDSGLRAALQAKPSHLACLDEFTKKLAAMAQRNSPHLIAIKDKLLEVSEKAHTVWLAAAYADHKERPPVEVNCPNLCVYGTGVPSELFTTLDRGALADGFLNRWLVFFADEQFPTRNQVGRAEPPAELVTSITQLELATRTVPAGSSLAGANPNAIPVARTIHFADDARKAWTDLEDANEKRIAQLRQTTPQLADLWVRFAAHVAKLALIRSVGTDPAKPIDTTDVAWASETVVWCIGRLMAEAENRVADSQQEAHTKRVLRIILESGPVGVSSSDLTRQTQWLRRTERKEILMTLQESGQAVSEEIRSEGKRKPTTWWVGAHFRAMTDDQQVEAFGRESSEGKPNTSILQDSIQDGEKRARRDGNGTSE